jgi:Tfp pilus assembly protein PilF
MRKRLITFACTALLAGCAMTPPGLLETVERPAEKALLGGLRAYEDGQYPAAEKLFEQALQARLASPKDRAAAHKHLAFIYCTSERAAACAAEFQKARAADPKFGLSKSEAGHPQWGPVYQRLRP